VQDCLLVPNTPNIWQLYSRPGSVYVSTKGLASFLVFLSHSEAKCRVLKTSCSWQNAIITWTRCFSSLLIAAKFVRDMSTAISDEDNWLPASIFTDHYNKLYSESCITMHDIKMTLYDCLLYITLSVTLSVLDAHSLAYSSLSDNFSLEPTHFSRSISQSFTRSLVTVTQFHNHSFPIHPSG
jgi:hypothetical protein